jgi:hypothetical protein
MQTAFNLSFGGSLLSSAFTLDIAALPQPQRPDAELDAIDSSPRAERRHRRTDNQPTRKFEAWLNYLTPAPQSVDHPTANGDVTASSFNPFNSHASLPKTIASGPSPSSAEPIQLPLPGSTAGSLGIESDSISAIDQTNVMRVQGFDDSSLAGANTSSRIELPASETPDLSSLAQFKDESATSLRDSSDADSISQLIDKVSALATRDEETALALNQLDERSSTARLESQSEQLVLESLAAERSSYIGQQGPNFGPATKLAKGVYDEAEATGTDSTETGGVTNDPVLVADPLGTRSPQVPAVDSDALTVSEHTFDRPRERLEIQDSPIATDGTQSNLFVTELDAARPQFREIGRPAPGQPNVAIQIAREVIARADTAVRQGRTEFSMRLEPPELGTVRIHLTATDHAISARVHVSSESAQQLVESQLNSLRQSLADAGMSLQRFDISHGGQGSGQGHSHQDYWRAPSGYDHGGDVQPRTQTRAAFNAVRSITTRGRIDVMA